MIVKQVITGFKSTLVIKTGNFIKKSNLDRSNNERKIGNRNCSKSECHCPFYKQNGNGDSKLSS